MQQVRINLFSEQVAILTMLAETSPISRLTGRANLSEAARDVVRIGLRQLGFDGVGAEETELSALNPLNP
jgi:hypothetical protein